MVWWTDVGAIIEDTDPVTVAELKDALRYATDWIKAIGATHTNLFTADCIPPNLHPSVTCGWPVGGTSYLEHIQNRPVAA